MSTFEQVEKPSVIIAIYKFIRFLTLENNKKRIIVR
ncbi:hypothetical protein BCI9360_00847 [Bacillus sp. CECT 9360]|nr:hypothetical protein BCI9360_00847 [Bacillus sp. CECT 9360]